MRNQVVSPLLFLLVLPTWAQTVPAGWTVVKDSKHACQIAVPSEWAPWADNSGAAVFSGRTKALARVTRPPRPEFQNLNGPPEKSFRPPHEKNFLKPPHPILYT